MSYPYSSLFLETYLAKQRLAQAFRDKYAASPPLSSFGGNYPRSNTNEAAIGGSCPVRMMFLPMFGQIQHVSPTRSEGT